MTKFVQACIAANREIALMLRGSYPKSFFKKGKRGAGGDISYGLDLAAETIFIRHLGAYGTIDSEESGVIGEGKNRIILDPIDGSSNALSYFPYYGTSVMRVDKKGKLKEAVICNLVNGDLFFKVKGSRPKQGKLTSSLFETPRKSPVSPVGLFEKSYNYPELQHDLIKKGLKFRSPGALALSLAYARSVKYMLFVGEYRIYDLAAGLALCEDLEVIVDDDYVIVSQDKKLNKLIEKLVKKHHTKEI